MILTFKEWVLFVGINIDFSELADSDLFRKCLFKVGLWVESITVCAKSVGFELFLSKSDA